MFVGSFQMQPMLCKREVVPVGQLKPALSEQATPRSAAMNLHEGSSRSFLDLVAELPGLAFLFTHGRPVPKNLVLRGHTRCCLGCVQGNSDYRNGGHS